MVPCAEPSAFERANSAVGHDLARLHVAGDNGGGIAGLSIEPSGMTISIGFRQPAFIGIGSSTMTRNT